MLVVDQPNNKTFTIAKYHQLSLLNKHQLVSMHAEGFDEIGNASISAPMRR